jgi:hypothetical protein
MLIYDCEIVKAILGKGLSPKPGISYCQGWDDYKGMGISVICAYDYEDHRYRVFCKDNFAEFEELARNRFPRVGFNNIKFDNALLAANGLQQFDADSSYDLLVEIWCGAGLLPIWQGFETHGGFGLDAVCAANFGMKKTGNGALAPVLWQEGKIGQVIDYCLEDVRLTKVLLDAVVEKGWIINPKTGKRISIRRPQ